MYEGDSPTNEEKLLPSDSIKILRIILILHRLYSLIYPVKRNAYYRYNKMHIVYILIRKLSEENYPCVQILL